MVLGIGESGSMQLLPINQQAFYNYGQQAANNNMGNLWNAYVGNQAPQANGTALGAVATYGGAQLGPASQYGGTNLPAQMMGNAAQINTAPENQFRGGQVSLANLLGAQAQGKGPSLAEAEAKKQSEQNIAGQMAVLGSQRGASNPALAQRQAKQGAASAQQQAAEQAVSGRIQEQQNAQQALGGVLGSARGADQGTAQAQANLGQAMNLANLGAYNQGNELQANLAQQTGLANTSGMNANALAQMQAYQAAGLSTQDAFNAAMMQQGKMNQDTNMANLNALLQNNQLGANVGMGMLGDQLNQNANNMEAQMALQNLEETQNYQANSLLNNQAAQSAQNSMQLLGAGSSALGGIAALGMMSDRRNKQNINDGSRDLQDFLRRLNAA